MKKSTDLVLRLLYGDLIVNSFEHEMNMLITTKFGRKIYVKLIASLSVINFYYYIKKKNQFN